MANIVVRCTSFMKVFYQGLIHLPHTLWQLIKFIPFFGLLLLILVAEPIKYLASTRVLKPVARTVGSPFAALYAKLLVQFNKQSAGDMSPEDLVLLALSHLRVKKARSMITIGGMAIGFGSVIFLLSIGYGFQRLIVSRVATLGEMQQIDVTTGQASSLVFNSETIDNFLGLEEVEAVLPVIATVSKVNFNNSVSDVVAYGVTTKFLEESAIQPVQGEIFSDEEYISDASDPDQLSAAEPGAVAGAEVELIDGAGFGKELNQVRYALFPLAWKPVYERPSTDSKIVGYTKRVAGERPAREVWGGSYPHAEVSLYGGDDQGNTYMTWISDTLPLWQRQACGADNFDCVDNQYVIDRGPSGQRQVTGFFDPGRRQR